MRNVLTSETPLQSDQKLALQKILDEMFPLVQRAQHILGEHATLLPIVTALVDSHSVLTPERQPELRSHAPDSEQVARRFHIMQTLISQTTRDIQ